MPFVFRAALTMVYTSLYSFLATLIWYEKIGKKIINSKLSVYCSVVYHLLCNGHFFWESSNRANLKIDKYVLVTRYTQVKYQNIRSYITLCWNFNSKVKFSDRITELWNRMTYMRKHYASWSFDLGGIELSFYHYIFEN